MKLNIITKNVNLKNFMKIITFTGYYKILQSPLVHEITADVLSFCLFSLSKSLYKDLSHSEIVIYEGNSISKLQIVI